MGWNLPSPSPPSKKDFSREFQPGIPCLEQMHFVGNFPFLPQMNPYKYVRTPLPHPVNTPGPPLPHSR